MDFYQLSTVWDGKRSHGPKVGEPENPERKQEKSGNLEDGQTSKYLHTHTHTQVLEVKVLAYKPIYVPSAAKFEITSSTVL